MTAAPNILQFEKPAASVVMISPEVAGRWLDERNLRNRKLREAIVNGYARDMVAGNWRLTGEALKFAKDGSLLDGQHRLAAVIKSGCTVAMFVVRGLDNAVQDVMDTGSKRTAADVLQLAGVNRSTLLAAATRLAIAAKSAPERLGRYQPTHSEIAAFIAVNPDLAEACELMAPLARRTDCPPAIVAYTYWVLSKIDPEGAMDFWIAAADKVGLTIGDPVLALTNRFAEARRNREAVSRAAYLSTIYRAWNARRAGKTMRFIRVNSSSGDRSMVPIPEPK